MKQLAAITLLTAGLATVATAQQNSEPQLFFGIEAGTADLSATNAAGNDYTQKENIYGVRLGSIEGDTRGTLSINRFDNSDKDAEMLMGTYSVDKYLFQSNFQAVGIKPYIGLHLGYGKYEVSTAAASEKESDLLYGGQAGLVMDFNKHFDVELLYRYSTSGSSLVDDIGTASFAVNFPF